MLLNVLVLQLRRLLGAAAERGTQVHAQPPTHTHTSATHSPRRTGCGTSVLTQESFFSCCFILAYRFHPLSNERHWGKALSLQKCHQCILQSPGGQGTEPHRERGWAKPQDKAVREEEGSSLALCWGPFRMRNEVQTSQMVGVEGWKEPALAGLPGGSLE